MGIFFSFFFKCLKMLGFFVPEDEHTQFQQNYQKLYRSSG